MVLMAATIFVLFFSTSVEMLLAGNILSGIPWGIFQTLTTAYAAEICPTAIRGYLTAWVSMCWGAGSFLAAGVLRGSLNLSGDAGWKVPYGVSKARSADVKFADLIGISSNGSGSPLCSSSASSPQKAPGTSSAANAPPKPKPPSAASRAKDTTRHKPWPSRSPT